MQGLAWTAVIWLLTAGVVFGVIGRRRSPSSALSWYSAGAIVLLLLGTHSTAATIADAGTGLGVETLVRGALASAALLLAMRVLLINGRAGRAGARGQRIGLVLLSLYTAVAALSASYSVAPLQTVGKGYELTVAVVIVWAIATSPSAGAQLRAAAEFVVMLEASLLLVAIAGYVVLPSQFVLVAEGRPGFIFEATMAAPYAHSNGLSAVGAMVGAYALAKAFQMQPGIARRPWYALAAAATVGIALASGRQGVIIWLVGVGLLLFLYARPLFVFGAVPTMILAVQEWGSSLWEVLTRQQQEITLYTLSGRLDYWKVAVEAWRTNPIFGYGYGVGGRLVALESIGEAAAGSLHSGYFEALVGVGLLGVVPFTAAVWVVCRWSYRSLRAGRDIHLAILLVPMVLHTAVSLGFAAWLSSEFLLLALLIAIADDRRRSMTVGGDRELRPVVGNAEPVDLFEAISREFSDTPRS